jgi:hypothetical protein
MMKHGSTPSPATSLRVGIANKRRQTRARPVAQQTNAVLHRDPSRQPSAKQSRQQPANEPAKRPRTKADSTEDDASSADEEVKKKKKKEDEKAKIKRDKNKASQQKKRLRNKEFVSRRKSGPITNSQRPRCPPVTARNGKLRLDLWSLSADPLKALPLRRIEST